MSNMECYTDSKGDRKKPLSPYKRSFDDQSRSHGPYRNNIEALLCFFYRTLPVKFEGGTQSKACTDKEIHKTPLSWHAAQLCYIDFGQLRSCRHCKAGLSNETQRQVV